MRKLEENKQKRDRERDFRNEEQHACGILCCILEKKKKISGKIVKSK